MKNQLKYIFLFLILILELDGYGQDTYVIERYNSNRAKIVEYRSDNYFTRTIYTENGFPLSDIVKDPDSDTVRNIYVYNNDKLDTVFHYENGKLRVISKYIDAKPDFNDDNEGLFYFVKEHFGSNYDNVLNEVYYYYYYQGEKCFRIRYDYNPDSYFKYEPMSVLNETMLDNISLAQGEWIFDYQNMHITYNYVNGRKNGIYAKRFGKDLIENGLYENNLKIGNWKERFEFLVDNKTFNDSITDFSIAEHFKHNFSSSGNYIFGKKEGKWQLEQRYNSDVKWTIYYKNGIPSDIWSGSENICKDKILIYKLDFSDYKNNNQVFTASYNYANKTIQIINYHNYIKTDGTLHDFYEKYYNSYYCNSLTPIHFIEKYDITTGLYKRDFFENYNLEKKVSTKYYKNNLPFGNWQIYTDSTIEKIDYIDGEWVEYTRL